jgi:predicted transcriptional regulator
MQRTEQPSERSQDATREPAQVTAARERRVQIRNGNTDAVLRLLSTRNLELLRLIRARPPSSVAELGRMAGRPKASLMLTLRRLERAGVLVLQDGQTGRKRPVVVCDRVTVEVDLA